MLAFFILKPFLSTIIMAIVISYVSYPLYKWLNNKTHRKTISALITTFVIILVITIPTVFALNALSKEIFAGYLTTKQYLATGADTLKCESNAACALLKTIGLTDPNFNNFVTDTLGKATASIFNKLTSYVISLPKIMANIFIAIFLTYYLLKDGTKLANYAKSLLPIKGANLDLLFRRFNDVTYAVVYGNVVVAIIQGVLTTIGFFMFGITSPIIWGIVTMFTSLLPFLGAYIVWLPAAIFLLVAGYTSGEGLTLLKGVGLLVYGFIFISGIDNVLKPRIIGSRANLHPALVLIGVIGGLTAIGITGIIVGPVVIALAATVIQIVSGQKIKKSA